MAWGSRKVAAVDESSEQTYARAQARWKDDTRNRDKMLRYKAELAECRASLTSLRGARAARAAHFLGALESTPVTWRRPALGRSWDNSNTSRQDCRLRKARGPCISVGRSLACGHSLSVRSARARTSYRWCSEARFTESRCEGGGLCCAPAPSMRWLWPCIRSP